VSSTCPSPGSRIGNAAGRPRSTTTSSRHQSGPGPSHAGRALDAGVPASWWRGRGLRQDYKFRTWCERRRIGYVVAVPRSQTVPLEPARTEPITPPRAPEQAWKRRSCADGAKGPECRLGRGLGLGRRAHPRGLAPLATGPPPNPHQRPDRGRQDPELPTTCALARPAPPTMTSSASPAADGHESAKPSPTRTRSIIDGSAGRRG